MLTRRPGRSAVAIAAVLSSLLWAMPAAAGIFGVAQGPNTVSPGHEVDFSAEGMLPQRQIRVTIQPSYCVGSNGCAVATRGRWKSDEQGHVEVEFRFPRHYYRGCTAVGCAEQPPFLRGKHAQVQLCATGPEYVGEEALGYACAVKTVRIGGTRRATGT